MAGETTYSTRSISKPASTATVPASTRRIEPAYKEETKKVPMYNKAKLKTPKRKRKNVKFSQSSNAKSIKNITATGEKRKD